MVTTSTCAPVLLSIGLALFAAVGCGPEQKETGTPLETGGDTGAEPETGVTWAPLPGCGDFMPAVDALPVGLASLGIAEGVLEDYPAFSYGSAYGDQDGDGCADVALGDPSHGEGMTGTIYLVNGPVIGSQFVLAGEWDALILGEQEDDWTSRVESGYIDDDRYSDWVIGATSAGDSGNGLVYVVYGPVSGEMGIEEAEAEFIGEWPFTGTSNSTGDIDGSGTDDILVSCYHHETSDGEVGAAYLFYGPVTGSFAVSAADATFIGEKSGLSSAGSPTASGDLNADGYDDVVIAAPMYNGGRVYIMMGPAYGTYSLADADVTYKSPGADYYAGGALSTGSDVDGDGYGDLLVGAPDASGWTGRAYYLSGVDPGTHSLSTADAVIYSLEYGAMLGESVTLEPDLDGDGLGEVAVGCIGCATDLPARGAVYVFYTAPEGMVYARDADATLYNDDSEQYTIGKYVDSVGDFNADGYDELLVFGSDRSYILYGGPL